VGSYQSNAKTKRCRKINNWCETCGKRNCTFNISTNRIRSIFVKNKTKWDNIRATWQWRIADFIRNSKWKIGKIFYPLTRSIDNFENKLRKSAKKKFLDEKDIGNW
jgi:hypothetical protein